MAETYSTTYPTREAFDKVMQETNAQPHEPIPGDGRQYYTGKTSDGIETVFTEDTTQGNPKYTQHCTM